MDMREFLESNPKHPSENSAGVVDKNRNYGMAAAGGQQDLPV
jgi:hypothetical protein